MKPKDPYLSELDALGELVPEEEPTDIHLEAAPKTPTPTPPPPEESPLTMAEDVPVQMVVVLGRKGITMKDLMELKSGLVVELNRSTQDAVDLVVAGKVVAKGELVEIEGKLGVRVLKILK